MMNIMMQGILLPFLGTSFGAACVLFVKKELNNVLQRALIGFAAGVMMAAAFFSLLLPSMEQSAFMGNWAFVPAVVGFCFGILFLIFLNRAVFCLRANGCRIQEMESSLYKTVMLVLAVTLHNLPEGMAVGVVYAGLYSKTDGITVMGALALSLGIAIQNFPEGAIVSMPLRVQGMGKGKAFFYGIISGIVEPIGAVLTILAAGYVIPLLPYFLSFAAGVMVYVVVAELIPEMTGGKYSNVGTVLFTIGFLVMMTLDVTLG